MQFCTNKSQISTSGLTSLFSLIQTAFMQIYRGFANAEQIIIELQISLKIQFQKYCNDKNKARHLKP
jgi:hypothetical protein